MKADRRFETLKPGLWYLASPYSHDDPAVREARFWAVSRVAGRLCLDHNVKTFSPISHTHPIEIELGLDNPSDYTFWLGWDKEFYPFMRGIVITQLPLWEKSKGIAVERDDFVGMGKPEVMLDVRSLFSDEEWKKLGGSVDG